MRYVNWGVVSRHSHAPILISVLLSNNSLHLFSNRRSYSTSGQTMNYAKTILTHLQCRDVSLLEAAVFSSTCRSAFKILQASRLRLEHSYFLCYYPNMLFILYLFWTWKVIQ